MWSCLINRLPCHALEINHTSGILQIGLLLSDLDHSFLTTSNTPFRTLRTIFPLYRVYFSLVYLLKAVATDQSSV